MTYLIATIAALVVGSSTALADQPQPAAQPGSTPPAIVSFEDLPAAGETRQRLANLLRQLPPAVGEVLQRDPTLMARADYMAPYPALVAFLQQHPEVARNPSYFLGEYRYRDVDPPTHAAQVLEDVMEGFGVVVVMGLVIGCVTWLVRTAVDHRRWLRLSRTQAEVHTKLLDRLTTNDDLLAYIQSPAGRRFLESTPIALDEEPRAALAPLSRILWSLQAGVVLLALGAGFWFIQRSAFAEAADGFVVVSTLCLSLGAGFVASAGVAYLVSSRHGLVQPRRTAADV